VRNALHEMAALVATLHDRDGRVAVAGFDSDAAELTDRQRADVAAFPFDETPFMAEAGAAAHGDPAYAMRERITHRPFLDVNGMWGGDLGVGSKTIIPAEAHAKLTVRIVAGQDARRVIDAVVAHLKAHCPQGVELSFGRIGDGWFPLLLRPSETAEGMARIREAASAAGRDPDALGLMCMVTETGNLPKQVEMAGRYRGVGATHLVLSVQSDPSLRTVDQHVERFSRFAEAVRAG